MSETGLATRATQMALMTEMQNTGNVPHAPWMSRIESHAGWTVYSSLPIRLASRIPVTRFSIRNLLELRTGQVLVTSWSAMEDVPLTVGSVKLGWCEFEVLEKRLGVRITRLA